ncbi:hypothetical protein ACROYT_G021273 [Oculina patagonica]
MIERENGTICGLPQWLPIPSNDTPFFINDVVLSAVNVPFCAFAFIGNLAVIVAVIKTPSLQQRPCNILLCSLATTDCLTGLVAQPIFVAWRLMIHRIHESCDHQFELFIAYYVCQIAITGWSFSNIALISFDRHCALAKPLYYRAKVSKKVVPIVNHVGIFIAIRRHNKQIADAVSGQNAYVLFRREKKAAIDMIIVIAVLMLCLAPAIAVNMVERYEAFI